MWTLGEIREGTHPMMRAQSFILRTQPGGGAGDGALLVLVRMQGRREGNFPGASFRYLIPNDVGKHYSATVLISRERVLMAQLLQSFGDLIGDHDFHCVFDDDNGVITSTATGGALAIPGDKVLTKGIEFVHLAGKAWVDVESEFEGFSMAAGQRLVLESKGAEVSARWVVSGSTEAQSTIVDSSMSLRSTVHWASVRWTIRCLF